jgi:site-specific DNA recombinase
VSQNFIYVRISEDRTGSEAGVERQKEDCRAQAELLGLDVWETFVDNDISAYKNKRRPGYEAMMERLREAESIVLVWHVDRLYRKPRELEDLIALVETHPIRIEAVKGGAFDLNTHEGRLMARQLVAIASYESGHKADRIRRANLQKAQRGDWHGAAKFGYGIGGVLIPEEAAAIREMVDRFLAGQSLRSIASWLNEAGVQPSRSGKGTLGVWHPTSVRQLLMSARISGQRAYDPTNQNDGVNGRRILGPGNWQPIITAEETDRIRAIMTSPDRRTSKSSITMLAGIAMCGICGAGLVHAAHAGASERSKRARYICGKRAGRPDSGGVSVAGYQLEELIREAIVARLAGSSLDDVDPGDISVAATMKGIVASKERLGDLARDYGSGRLERGEFFAARDAAQDALQRAEVSLGRLTRQFALSRIPVGDELAVRALWMTWSIPQQRSVLTALVDRLVVNPALRPGRAFDFNRIELRFKA